MDDEAWLTGDLLDLDGGDSPGVGGFAASPLKDITASVNLTVKVGGSGGGSGGMGSGKGSGGSSSFDVFFLHACAYTREPFRRSAVS